MRTRCRLQTAAQLSSGHSGMIESSTLTGPIKVPPKLMNISGRVSPIFGDGTGRTIGVASFFFLSYRGRHFSRQRPPTFFFRPLPTVTPSALRPPFPPHLDSPSSTVTTAGDR